MKKFNLVASLVATLFATSVFAQNTTNKWMIGVGMHATDHTSVRGVFDGFFDTKDYSIVPPLSKITVARSIAKNFAIDIQGSIGELDNKRLAIKDEFFALVGGGIRYMPLSEKGWWFDPYIRVGANYHKYSYKGIEISESKPMTAHDNKYNPDKDYELKKDFKGHDNMFIVNGGVGLNFWITKNFGLNLESQYNWAPAFSQDYVNFFQHSVGVQFRFGNNDRDKDGIPDKEDRCPDVPGLPEFQGCPDTDGDGIPDPDDQCPDVPGPVENNGCPWTDTDGDGVPDKDDRCPDVAGPVEFQGCPDRDDDGIPDIDDRCFDVAGPKEFQGCPDTDGDGIPDIDDACPNEAGPASNNGCPITTETITKSLKNILFKFNSSELTDASKPLVSDAAKLLNDETLRTKKFFVDGHTDKVGTAAVNTRLSKQRAQSVVNELVKDGISRDRLEARGFGKAQLLCKDTDINKAKDAKGNILYPNQEECDKANRRVVVLDKSESKVTVKKQVEVKKAPTKKK